MNFFKKFFGGKDAESTTVKYSLIDYNKYFDNQVLDNIPLEFLDLGKLTISTGKIVACDPLVELYHTPAFTKTVQKGKYPVTACIAQTEESGPRYAVVKLEFSKQRAVKWELAVTEGQDPKVLEEDEFFGFPVEAGLGCFCDMETQVLYDLWQKAFMGKYPYANIYDDFFAAEFNKNAVDQDNEYDVGDWLNFSLPNKPEQNVIMFHSGFGDGMYACYWGVTDKGTICSLVVDFQVL